MKPEAATLKPALEHHLLLVDDEALILESLRGTLRGEGYQIATAPSAIEALALLKDREFSVVMSDQRMPLVTGLEFLAQVRQLQPDATRILFTGALELNTVIDAINQGEIYRFIVKPWLREELLVTVKNAVQRHDLLRANQSLQAATQAMNEKLVKLNTALEEQIARVATQNGELDRLNGALRQNLQRSVELCLQTMQTFYPSLGSQARRVFELCRALGEGLGLPPAQREQIEIAAWLHDIGLVGVPRQIIRRWEESPAALSEAERVLIEQHPVLGAELAGFAHPLTDVGALIRAHHERFDGTGYPDQLREENIPWLARLLAVAVAYAESRLGPEETLAWISKGKGTVFDPEAVKALHRCLPRALVPRRERTVDLAELQPGMVLARGVYNAGGLLLLPDGQQLTAAFIDKLNNHHRVTPITQSLLVYI
jgi:response regulator RpfG family c-di-GMP phosphodiesterase